MFSNKERLATFLAATILVFSPLAFGIVHPWSIVTFKTLVLLLALSVFWSLTESRFKLPKKNAFHLILGLVFILFVIQLLPLPSFIIKIVSPLRWNVLFGSLAPLGLGSPPLFHCLSLDPHATQKMFSIFIFIAAFYIALDVSLIDRSKIKLISHAIILSGFTVALIAIAQKFSGTTAIYWSLLPRQAFYGTFVNPNHCAVYLGATGIFALAHFLKEKSQPTKIVLGFIFAIITLAVFYSLSRGGILSFLTPLAFFLFFIFNKSKTEKRALKKQTFSLLPILLTLFVFLAWWGTFKFFGELSSLKDISITDYRFTLWRNALAIFKDFPVFGSGIGTFGDTIPMYRTFPGNVTVEFAENDYIQILSEAGLAGLAVMIALLFTIGKKSRETLGKKLSEIPRAKLGAIFAILTIAINCLVNFDIYIPGVMVLAVAMISFIFIPQERYK